MILQSRFKRPRRSPFSASQARLRKAASSCIEALEHRVLLSTTNATLLADASVTSAAPDTNSGGAADLFVQDPTAANPTQITYLKFDISGITPINSATLELNASLTNSGDPATTVDAFAVSDTTWTQNGITFNNAPAVGSSINGATISSTTPGIIDINLTSYIQSQKQAGNTTISLAIESSTPSADPAQFTSDSGGTAPALVIDDTPPAAPTGTLSAGNVSAANTQQTVVAEYSGPAAINLGTITTSNLSISGPSTATIGSVASVNSSNPDDVFATYDITAPNGSTWTTANNGNYTVTLKANQVEDANSNFAATTSKNFSVNVGDSTAPVVASISAPAITTTGSQNEAITVVYTDNVAVSVSTIADSNISVSGPGGSRSASSFSTSTSSNAATITATYQIPAPSGGWTIADNGSYTITIGAGAVTDTSGNGVAANSGSSYSVNVSDSTPPVASSISAPNISVVGGDTQTVTVVYTDNVAVNASTIGIGDITVTGGPAAISITSVATNPSSNSSLITATYTVTKTNNQPWAFADNGTYTITVLAGAVTDTSGNSVATKTGSFTVGLPQPDTTPPTDTITAPNVTAPGGTSETVTVVYTDNVAINTATITNSSVSVSGPGGTLVLSNLTTLPASNGPTITAIYTFTAPGGAWTAADNGTYTVTVAANAVKDTSGNADAGNSKTFTVNATVPDTTPPVAVLTAPNVTAPGAATEVVTAVYTDNVAVDTSTIAASNITVSGPGGAVLTVSGVTVTGSGATVTAAYAVNAPGGAWAASANGSYTVTLGANKVKDTSANPAATTSTTFTVNATVPNITPPTVNIIAPSLTSASLANELITVIYTDAGIVNASTITASNLTVTGPGGALTVASVSKSPAGNADTITATYSVTPANGGWTSTSNGTYQVSLKAGQVKDTSNNAAPATNSSFTVNIPTPPNPNDPTFNSGNPVALSFTAEGAAVLSNGQIAIVGEEGSAAAGKSQGVIELFNADGSVASGFGTNGIVATPQSANEAFHAVIAQGNNIIVAGSGGGFLLQRYNTSGQLDGSFGISGSVVTNFGSANEAAFAMAQNPAGDIVAAGTADGNVAFAEYSANGSLVTSFGQSGRQLFDVGSPTGVIGAVGFQSNGDLVAVGSSSAQVVVVRLNTSGNADTTFGTSGLVIVPGLVANTSLSAGDHSEGLAIEPDNSILVANQTAGGHFGLVHLDANGNVVSTFGTNGLATASFGSNDDADYVAVQPGGQIIVAGTTNVSGTPTALAAFDQSGAPIASFGLLGKLLLPASVSASNELVSGSSATTVFGARTTDGHIFTGTSSGTSTVRKLSVAGTQNANAGTPLGSFGVSGKKNVKLTTTIAGVKVTIGITGGTGQAFLAANGLHLVISASSKGATLTITCAGGKRTVTLGDVTISGSLKSLSSKSANLAGTLSTTGTIGTLSLGNLNGGVIAAPGGINSLSLLSASDAKVLAGANLGADGEIGGSGTDADTFFSAALRTLKVAGGITNSIFAAGVDPIDGLYAPGDDTEIGGKASIIRSISARRIDASSRFIAGAFGTANIPKKVKPASDSHFELL